MQRLPSKKKTCKPILNETEKLAKDKYYRDLKNFYNINESEGDPNEKKYNVEYQPESNIYIVDEYDHNKFSTYGCVHDKKLYLTEEEVFYLKQIGLVKIINYETEIMDKKLNIVKDFLYSYLRRAGKLITCASIFKRNKSEDANFDNYFITYETLEDYKSKTPEMIITPFSDNSFTFELMSDIKNKAETIYKDNFMPGLGQIKFCVALIQGSAVHILSINDINPVNK